MLTTHDLRFAASVCTEIVLLGRGRVLAQGPPHDVLRADTVGALYEIDPALVASLVPR
jgi:ABC-type hemin transport system ATPase subunit